MPDISQHLLSHVNFSLFLRVEIGLARLGGNCRHVLRRKQGKMGRAIFVEIHQ